MTLKSRINRWTKGHKCRSGACIDDWSKAHSSRPPERNPKVIAFLIVLGLSVLPTATGEYDLPGSLKSINDQIIAQFAAAVVVFACALNVLGLLWPSKKIRDDWGHVLETTRDIGVGLELAACFLLSAGSGFYATVLWVYASPEDRVFAFGAFGGLAAGCLARTVQIALYVRGRKLNSTRLTR